MDAVYRNMTWISQFKSRNSNLNLLLNKARIKKNKQKLKLHFKKLNAKWQICSDTLRVAVRH